jgi:hypothetical protein
MSSTRRSRSSSRASGECFEGTSRIAARVASRSNRHCPGKSVGTQPAGNAASTGTRSGRDPSSAGRTRVDDVLRHAGAQLDRALIEVDGRPPEHAGESFFGEDCRGRRSPVRRDGGRSEKKGGLLVRRARARMRISAPDAPLPETGRSGERGGVAHNETRARAG